MSNSVANQKAARNSWLSAVDLTALGLMGTFCFLYSVYGSDFAEQHLSFAFIDFPVFVGEILLFCCLVLAGIKRALRGSGWERWEVMAVGYLLWVLINALTGYGTYGPIAFRNAALFYYPAFIFLGYIFFNRDIFSRFSVILAILLGACIGLEVFDDYFWLSAVVLFLVLLLRFHKTWLVVCGFAYIALFGHVGALFRESRSRYLIAGIGACIFIFYFCFKFYLRDRKTKILAGIVFVVLMLAGVKFFADHNGVLSMLDIKPLLSQYRAEKEIINQQSKNFVPRALPAKTYSPNTWRLIKGPRKEFSELKVAQGLAKEDLEKNNTVTIPDGTKGPKINKENTQARSSAVSQDPVEHGAVARDGVYRSLTNAYTNSIFRLLIWEDMAEELWEQKAVFGVGFGKPQRSKSLEILDWAGSEWKRDGWITPHNSFLHIVYRAGIIGLLLIIVLFSTFLNLLRTFVRHRALEGILLLSVMIYWMVMANFLLIFELPYFAIPMWTVFGLAFGYAGSLRNAAAPGRV